MAQEPGEILEQRHHRPWALPSDPWILYQSWRDLAFLHWPIARERLAPSIPAGLELEEHDGSAWVSMTPLVLSIRPRGVPAFAGLGWVPELNLRTYVRVRDKPGIFFFSLDIASRLAVTGARTFYRLPYFRARIRVTRHDGWFDFRSERVAAPGVSFSARYRPSGPASEPSVGTLDYFLTERYCLYVVLSSGHVHRTDIHHVPWLLQPAELRLQRNTVPAAAGAPIEGEPALVHYARAQDVLTWGPRVVAGERGATAAGRADS